MKITSNGTDSGVGESVLITQPPLGGWSPSYSKGVLGGTRAVGVGRNAPALILFFSIMEVENRYERQYTIGRTRCSRNHDGRKGI